MFRHVKVEGSTCFGFFLPRPNMEEDHIRIDAQDFFPLDVIFSFPILTACFGEVSRRYYYHNI